MESRDNGHPTLRSCDRAYAFADGEATARFFDDLHELMMDEDLSVMGREYRALVDRQHARWRMAAKLWRAANKPLPVKKLYTTASLVSICRYVCSHAEVLPLVAGRKCPGMGTVFLEWKIEEMCSALYFSCLDENDAVLRLEPTNPEALSVRATAHRFTFQCIPCIRVLHRNLPEGARASCSIPEFRLLLLGATMFWHYLLQHW